MHILFLMLKIYFYKTFLILNIILFQYTILYDKKIQELDNLNVILLNLQSKNLIIYKHLLLQPNLNLYKTLF